MENNYPESWHRQTPKGYEVPIAVKEKCCECSCDTETETE